MLAAYTIQDAVILRDVSVQQLLDHYAPVLHFNLDERYAMPFDVQTSLVADAAGGVPDWLRVTGNAADSLDLSLLATGVWPRESSSRKVYASVLACPADHATCAAGQELAINYWVHYPRSNWSEYNGVNEHAGDLT